MASRPAFEECAWVVAGHLNTGTAATCARDMQRAHGYCEYKLMDRAREMLKADPRRFQDLSHEYNVVAEMLEYFEHYKLATWAPLAAIIKRERSHREASTAKLEADMTALVEALRDVENRLGHLQRYAESEGRQLSGNAFLIANDLNYVRRIATEALTRIQGDDACGGGE